MNERRIPQERNNLYSTELLSKETWPKYKDQITELLIDCFPQHNFSPKFVESIFTKTFANDVIVLLRAEDGKVIGLTQAHIYTQQPDTANIGMTGIATAKRGQKLVGVLMEKMEEELRGRGVTIILRQSRIADGYADAIERHYKDRVLEKNDDDIAKSPDPKRNFKIRL